MHKVVSNFISIQNEIKTQLKYNNQSINIIAVSKTFSIEHIKPLIDFGHNHSVQPKDKDHKHTFLIGQAASYYIQNKLNFAVQAMYHRKVLGLYLAHNSRNPQQTKIEIWDNMIFFLFLRSRFSHRDCALPAALL